MDDKENDSRMDNQEDSSRTDDDKKDDRRMDDKEDDSCPSTSNEDSSLHYFRPSISNDESSLHYSGDVSSEADKTIEPRKRKIMRKKKPVDQNKEEETSSFSSMSGIESYMSTPPSYSAMETDTLNRSLSSYPELSESQEQSSQVEDDPMDE